MSVFQTVYVRRHLILYFKIKRPWQIHTFFHQLLKLSFVKSPLHRGTNNSFQLWPQMRPLRHQIWHLRPQIRPIGHQTENGNWRKLPLCGIVGHWPFRGRCSSHRLILTYTNIGASGTADHATLLQLFFLPLLVPLPRPNEILLGLPTSGAARCPRIKRPAADMASQVVKDKRSLSFFSSQ